MSSTSAKDLVDEVSQASRGLASDLARSADRRVEIPIRVSFIRNDDPAVKAPLAELVSTGGRGGAVPLKLYMALIWRSAAEPFETEILARKWAQLLDLQKPDTLGARRVTGALSILEAANLVKLDRRRGESTVVTLLEESGSGAPYSLPSTAYVRAAKATKPRHRYVKVPVALWTKGYIQSLTAPGIAMLLILLESRNRDGRPTWWSTTVFPARFSLSPAVRSRGTTDLLSHALVHVTKELVDQQTGSRSSFGRDKVRNLYRLRGEARPQEMKEQMKKESAQRRTARAIMADKHEAGDSEKSRKNPPTVRPAKKASATGARQPLRRR